MTRAHRLDGVDEGWVEVDGHRLHYLTAGDGPPVILLHGGIIDAAALSWGAVVEPLAETRRVIALDVLGYGGSDAPDVEYSTGRHVDVLAGVVEALDLDSTALVGLSLGGAVALGYALREPDRVDELVLVDSHGLGAPPPRRRLTFVLSRVPVLNRLSVALLRRSRGLVRASLGGVVHDPDALPDDVIDRLYDLVRQPDAGKAFRRWRRTEVTWHGYRTDYRDRLPDLAVPTLVVHGAEDDLFPVEYAERAAEAIPGAELAVIGDCAHWPPREAPEEFVGIVSAFLDDDTAR